MDYYDLQVDKIIERAVEEDLGWGDVTTDNLIPEGAVAVATLATRQSGIACGIQVALKVFQKVDRDLSGKLLFRDGQEIHPGDVILEIEGHAASILRAERVALNFVQRMSGIATETARYVEAVRGLPVRIADTRKTVPCLRVLDKYAVKTGGGLNHRLHLGDGMLVKDNHISVLGARGFSIRDIVASARRSSPRIQNLEIEAKTVEEAEEAADAGADIILLDNMDLNTLRQAVTVIDGRALIEASGGVTLQSVRAIAEAGVDFISVGALTHSVKALDMALDIRLV